MEALIFIPDISGYTEFVTKTEIRHSKHIISELIEVIINGNKIGMKVSEIEGDAVLFYRPGKAPAFKDLLNQAKDIFIAFHSHIKVIQRDNVCQCGACRTSINLTLKFVAHFGQLQETTIQNFAKIMGSDVILAHRLLKNSINEKEYLLITDNYFKAAELNEDNYENWIIIYDHVERVENFSDVGVKYILLTKLRAEVPETVITVRKDFSSIKTKSEIFIEAPIQLVHELLTDHEAKLDYVPGLKDIRADSSINRVNSSHTCVFDDIEIGFKTQSNDVRGKEIIYIEEATVSIGVSFIMEYRLKEENNGTKVFISRFPKFSPRNENTFFNRMINKLKTLMVLIKLKLDDRKTGHIFKSYCEKIARERNSSNWH